MKIGILTFHACYNLGAMLQSYATQEAIIASGAEPEIIDYYPREQEKRNRRRELKPTLRGVSRYIASYLSPTMRRRIANFEHFRSKLRLSGRYFDRRELYEADLPYDRLLIGSDQVWNMENGGDPLYFGDFAPEGMPKYSYGSSFGTASVDRAAAARLSELLKEFAAISVREDTGVKLIREYCDRDAVQVLDPTLLLTAQEWRTLIPEARIDRYRKLEKGFVLTMYLPENAAAIEVCRRLREKFRLPVVAVGAGARNMRYADVTIHDAGPLEMLWFFDRAAAVCSSSFHGTAFALNFGKPLWVLPLGNRRNTRMESLLRQFGLFARMLDSDDIVLNDDAPNYLPDLECARKKSKEFLSSICREETE